MAAPVRRNVLPIVPVELIETARRRQIAALQSELRDVAHVLRENPQFQDEKTGEIIEWHNIFSSALERAKAIEQMDVDSILQICIGQMQEILRDPISLMPLNQDSFLGSDGWTYSQMSLTLYRLSVQEEFRERSPMNVQDPTPLRIAPHVIVRHMLTWLDNHHALLRSEAHERLYNEAMAQRNPPRMSREERMRLVQGRREELQREEEDLRRRRAEQNQDNLRREIRQILEPINVRRQEFRAGADRQFMEIQRRDQEDLQRVHRGLQILIENNQDNRREFQADIPGVEQLINLAERRIADLRQRNDELRVENQQLGADLAAGEREIRHLEVRVNEVSIAREKNRQSTMNQLFKVGLMIGISYVGGWAAKGILEAMGASFNFAIVPTNSGPMAKIFI